MKIHLYCLLLTMMLVGAGSAAPATIDVNCGQGETLADALTVASAGDTITATGVCRESVSVTVSGLTLDGSGRASIIGGPAEALTVDGAERVVIRGFKLRDSLHGLVIRGGASASLAETTVRDNVVMGIKVTGNSSLEIDDSVIRDTNLIGLEVNRSSEVEVTGELTVQNSGVFGINLASNSSITFQQADVGVHDNTLGVQISIGSSAFITDAVTTVNSSNNLTTGFTVNSGSTLFLFEGTLISSNNQFNHGLSVSSNSSVDMDRAASITLDNNGIDGIRLENSHLNLFTMQDLEGPTIKANGNARHGVSAFLGSTIDLTFDSVITARHNGDAGLLADNGSAVRVINSTFSDNGRDVVLSFGTRAELNDSTIGSIECDSTVLLRGDTGVVCPIP